MDKVTPDGGIVKLLMRPPTNTISPSHWIRGANAKFHYTTYAYLTPEDAEKFDEAKEEEDCHHSHDHDQHHHHEHGEQCAHDKEHHTKPKEGKKKSYDSDKPVRRKVADSRENDPSKPFELRIGYSFSVKAFELCVKTMGLGEKARFLCLPEYCDGYVQLEKVLRQERENALAISKGLPPTHHTHTGCAHAAHQEIQQNSDLAALYGVPLEFEFDLLDLQSPSSFVREPWEMSVQEKWAEAPTRKDEGGKFYKEGKWKESLNKYERALMLLESVSMSTEVQDKRRFADRKDGKESVVEETKEGDVDIKTLDTLMQACRLNYAACKLKLSDYPAVITQCTEVLNNDPVNLKGLFRRAQAYVRLGRDLDLAEKDYERVKKVLEGRKDLYQENGPEWAELRREEKVLEAKLKAHRDKEKKMFGKMFE